MPFFNTNANMKSDKNKKNKRPYRMINVSFPPAKYGVFAAIIIIVICLTLLLIN